MNTHKPLVSVICLCYNHSRYITEALQSILDQTYTNWELIIIDDASNDDSVVVINDFIKAHPHILFISLKDNVGNCRAFNIGLAKATGDFIIDLAGDDILLPTRIEKGVNALTKAGTRFGVNFSDAEYIDVNGKRLYIHSEKHPHHTIPQGNIYKDLIARFFICPPTVMFRRQVIDLLNGYDESLAYEDFDFWVRSSRNFLYCYTPEVIVKKRVVPNSLSAKQFHAFSPQLYTTFKICQKILDLNKTVAEQKALNKRIAYELSICLRLFNFRLMWKYILLWIKNRSKHCE